MLLVIDSATAACSVALVEHGAVIDERHEVVGRGHAERLVPMIAEMLGKRRPRQILVDCGPGSFTGVRVGLAAAISAEKVFGSGSADLVSLRGYGEAQDALPRAADAVLLPEPLRSLPPRPIYGRSPDAKPMQ